VYNGNQDEYTVRIKDAAIFSNLIGFKKLFKSFQPGKQVTLNFSDAYIVDHTFMEQLHHFEEEYQHGGGKVNVQGFEYFEHFSNHPLAARKLAPASLNKFELKLNARQVELRKFAAENEFTFYPQKVRNTLKYKDFPIQNGSKFQYEENVLAKYTNLAKYEFSDITLTEVAMQSQNDIVITSLMISEHDIHIPDFALEPEGLWSKFSELSGGKDIDFKEYPIFSKKYYLRSDNEPAVRSFFTESMVRFFESHEEMHVECHKSKLLIYVRRDVLDTNSILVLQKFADELMFSVDQSVSQPA
jgi:hypothetical protein